MDDFGVSIALQFVCKQDVLTANIKLLETYKTQALTSVEMNKASAVEVLRLQIHQNELEQLKQVLIQQYNAEQIPFNMFLNRDKNIEINVVNAWKQVLKI